MGRALVLVMALALVGSAQAQRAGISAEQLQVFADPAMPGKEFRVQRTTYAPGGQNPKHYHASHVVFFVLEGAGVLRREVRDTRPPHVEYVLTPSGQRLEGLLQALAVWARA